MDVAESNSEPQRAFAFSTPLIWLSITLRLVLLAPEAILAAQRPMLAFLVLLLIVAALTVLIPAWALLRPKDASPRLASYDVVAVLIAAPAWAAFTDLGVWQLGLVVIAGAPFWWTAARSTPVPASKGSEGRTALVHVLLALAAGTHILVMGLIIVVYSLVVPTTDDPFVLLRLTPFVFVAFVAMLAPVLLFVLSAKKRLTRAIAVNVLVDLLVVAPTLITLIQFVGPMLLVSVPLRIAAVLIDRRRGYA